ncbi:uncharacterized protein PHALS_00625 [Plasmopara halstedii]|uniref:Uncharacterized protein n=1 Tax=Plasmopara halstedii TaxID=4781 RepID=A0A0P1B7H4_PLAHL|nr:uncharacterized protein PHALS_00625 [Plasmopara halstedii]CEG50482.1 hypothetical protein PHALS_00625 [Plasmopara halstedii]|eukprot:XP_024586851.1 hypothetical protein PHALS_00625 [Plasmopara halstedii]
MLMPKAITYGISQDLPTLFHYAIANNDLLLVSFAWTLPKLFAVSTGSRKIFLVT